MENLTRIYGRFSKSIGSNTKERVPMQRHGGPVRTLIFEVAIIFIIE